MQVRSWLLGLLIVSGWFNSTNSSAADPLPRSLDPRLKIELFAENPQIATPTGIDVDSEGRVWAIESNTHFPPEDYQGHKTDRLLVMRDSDSDGRADQISVFADGFTHAMSVAVRPVWFPILAPKTNLPETVQPKFSVYVATRREILLLHDDDGDLKADRTERLVHLDTTGNYPHNGLAGFAFDATGWMFFGFGENLGADYKIIGADGVTLSGGGEGGSIYRTSVAGTHLTRWSTGFWNPHASCIDGFGRMFAVDNDPDSRPPCRLLHIIPGGDYGYRFRNGRKGLHPFTAWNGEIPGTLPMVAGTGEAPSGIVAYEADGLPNDFIGNLLVGSWGDHRIDRYKLKNKGNSFTSLGEPLIVGDENFRPVGLAVAPDGSLYCTDWVSREYKLHGKGRIWRISTVKPLERQRQLERVIDLAKSSEIHLYDQLHSANLAIRRAAAYYLGKTPAGRSLLVTEFADSTQATRARLEAFWASVNLSLTAEPPIDLLVGIRNLSAAHSRTLSFSLDASRASRQRDGETPSSDEVQCSSLWLRGTTPSTSIVYSQVLNLANRSAGLSRSRDEAMSSYSLATAIGRRKEILRANSFPFSSTSSESWNDPFTLLVNSNYLSHAESPDVIRAWWSSLQPQDTQPGVDLDDPAERQVLIERLQNATPEQRAVILDQARARRGGAAGRFATGTRVSTQLPQMRAALILAARQRFPQDQALVALFLKEAEPQLRRLAIQWAAEEKMKELRPQVEALLKDPALTSELLLATLAGLEMLDGVNPVDFDKTPASKYVVPLVQKEGSANVRALALQMVSPSDPALTADLFKQLLASPDERLRLEAIRTLQLSPLPDAPDLLVGIAGDVAQSDLVRAEAIAGLCNAIKSPAPDNPARKVLHKILLSGKPVLIVEALRTLRGNASEGPSALAIKHLANNLPTVEVNPPMANVPPGGRPRMGNLANELEEQIRLAQVDPKTRVAVEPEENDQIRSLTQWYEVLGIANGSGRGGFGAAGSGFGQIEPGGIRGEGRGRFNQANARPGDPNAGRRVFFHANSAGCFKCHTVEGRGGQIGPDLTTVARTMDRAKLAQSILEPSREISPQFVSWSFELNSGKTLNGLLLSEESEKLKVGTADGKVHDLTLKEIENRVPQSVSLMPEKLNSLLTPQELIDLIAFLESLK